MKHFTLTYKLPAVLPFTGQGKFLVFILRLLYGLVGLFFGRKWTTPPKGFEENPAYFGFKDVLFLGYKYYIQPPYEFGDQLENYFKDQDLNFNLPEGFVQESSVSITAGGDLMPYARISPENTRHLWDEVGEWFFGADIVTANLETPVYPDKPASLVPEVMLSNMLFNGSEAMFSVFNGNGQFKGYDVLSTANNHSFDMGRDGVSETIKFLENQKIAFTGTARTARERTKFPIVEKKGIRTAFISYTYSLNQFEVPAGESWLVNHIRLNLPDPDLSEVRELVSVAHERGADLVVLFLHTGNAYQPYPSEHTIAVYHRLFEECGVDVILGSHPHNPQPMEKYVFDCPFSGIRKQGFAIYSLADFVAYDIFVWDRLVPLLKLTVVKGKVQGKSHTQLAAVEVLPVFNWGNPDGREIRFFNLKKLINEKGETSFPAYFTSACRQEALCLNEFCDRYFIRDKQKEVIVK
jgi:hypothetical protein